MANQRPFSNATRNNLLVDVCLFLGAAVASLSGIYFLFLPVGGYQGGRNPMYGVSILFERHTWEDLHTWGGILMIIVAVIHIAIHWSWIIGMTKRITNDLFGRGKRLNNRSRMNAGINAVIGISFLIAAISGIYLLFFPGGAHGVPDPGFIFQRNTWDLIHTWAGNLMIIAFVIHLSIHWKWVTKVSSKFIRSVTSSKKEVIPSIVGK